ncbi:hypothetical protein KC326_g7909 [Hortaea werneckii]|nr:hypothetical protein KC326_g7909 [Hortaea werneckii]
MDPNQHQQQQQDHENLLVSLDSDGWLEDDELYDHEPVTVACASRHTMQYLSPRRAWTRNPHHHLPPPPPFGVTTYESAKQLMANSRGKNPTTPYAVMFAGGLCGILTTSLIYAIDVAKTLYQKALLGAGSGHATRPPISFFQTGSYRGLAVSVVRSCLLNMIFFCNFEWLGLAGSSSMLATLPLPRYATPTYPLTPQPFPTTHFLMSWFLC